MASREFHGIILNAWDKPLRFEKGDCDSGEWTEDWEPSKVPGAGLIEPGERLEWRSESDGIMTGTSGWARWSVNVMGVHTEFVQVNWSIPFLGEPTITCGVFRGDPDDAFRESQPPELELRPVVKDADGNPRWGSQGGDQPLLAEAASLAPYVLTVPFSFFTGPPWFVTHPRVGFVLRDREVAASSLQLARGGPSHEDELIQSVASRMGAAAKQGFVGGFPNFYEASRGPDVVGGTILIDAQGAEWRDVPVGELGNPSLVDFGARMRAANAYASSKGFVGAIPTYFHADHGTGTVCGVVLLSADAAEWRDVSLPELGDPALDDVPARFRATQDYATREGFVGGFPNMFHAGTHEDGRQVRMAPVCGTVLLKPGFAEWRDLVVFRGPR